ncbi:hypothetical protein OC844_001083 [Tilletia horrida]|nr:hypothetical protein OC844_001083 [Tilletia horrida]
MASRKRDLIERVKYPNPLPLPPYPPKLLNIPLAPERYAQPSFGDRLASEVPIPVLVDAEAGIHLDLPGAFPGLWLDDASTYIPPAATAAPPDINLNDIDPTDAFLLQDFTLALQQQSSASTGALAPGLDGGALKAGAGGAAAAAAAAHHIQNQHNAALGPLARTSLGANDVTWLRRTEYLSAEAKRQRAQEIKLRVQDQTMDVSQAAQVRAISRTFDAIHLGPGGRKPAAPPLSALKHPTKPGVHAVEAFEVLPDPETWATDFNIVRFLDWPGRTSKGGKPIPDPRLDVHLLRPHGDQNQIISVYMPSGDFGENEAQIQTEEEIEQEYQDAKTAAEQLENGQPSDEDGAPSAAQQALDAAEATRKVKLALRAYIDDTRTAVESLPHVAREDLAAARFAKRRRTGIFPEELHSGTAAAATAEDEGGEDVLEQASKAAFSTNFVHVRDYEPSTETGASATAGQLIFVFDDGKPDSEALSRIEAPVQTHGYTDNFPEAARARYGQLDIAETDPLTGMPPGANPAAAGEGQGEGEAQGWKTDSATAPPQSRIERAYRAKLIEQHGEEEAEMMRRRSSRDSRAALKAAYYHPIRMSFKLRMKRYKKSEKPSDHEDFWDAVEISQRHLSENEVYRRLTVRKDIDDLDHLALRLEEEEVALEEGEEDANAEVEDLDADADADADADGEADEDGGAGAAAGIDNAGEGDSENGDGDQNNEDEEDEDDGVGEDEDMDDDELAALRADAEMNGEEVGEEAEAEGGRSRRSRRSGGGAE